MEANNHPMANPSTVGENFDFSILLLFLIKNQILNLVILSCVAIITNYVNI